MQLIAQLFTAKQFDRFSGKIIHKQIKVTSYRPNGRNAEPNYSLVVNIDNGKSYNIDLDKDWGIDTILKKGDIIDIYNSSLPYKILSLDILDGGERVSQAAVNGKVVYRFDNHKREAWMFMAFLAAGILLFSFFLYDFRKNG